MTAGQDWQEVHRLMAERERVLAASGEPEGERLEQLLRDRARALAERTAPGTAQAVVASALVVRVGDERFGLARERLAGVLPLAGCAAIPHAPPELIGVFVARGALWSLYDLPRLLGMTGEGPAQGQTVLLRDERRRVALRVDAGERIDTYASDALRPIADAGAKALVAGVTPAGVPIIDMDALWAHGAMAEAM